MKFHQIVGLLFLFVSPLAFGHVDVLYANGKETKIEERLENLRFGSDKYDGESVAKVIAFINKHRQHILGASASKIYFRPNFDNNIDEGQARIVVNKGSASIRLQQVLYRKEQDGSRSFLPIEGADINVYVSGLKKMTGNGEALVFNRGELVELSTSLVNVAADKLDMITSEKVNKDLKISIKDKIKLIDVFREFDLQDVLSEIFPNHKSVKNEKEAFKYLIESPSLLNKILSDNKSRLNRMFVINTNGEHSLGWRLQHPYDLPLYIDFSISENGVFLFIKSHSNTKNVTVNIYRGTTFNLKKSKKRSGLSYVWKDKEIEGGVFKQEDYDLALINLSKVVEYFKSVFDWNGYDNKGSDLDATVRFKGSRLLGSAALRQNAAWAGSPYNQFLFGRGGDTLGDFLSAFDVIGHEYCHAIVAHTSQLEGGNETGALNEHVCDILGVGFEGDLSGKGFDFKIGESVVLESDRGLRDFLNPSLSFSEQPAHMSEVNAKFGPNCVPTSRNDECGVHYSNGVLNRSIGLSVKSLGWPRMKELIFEVVTKKLRSRSDFLDYKKQIVRTCEQLESFSKDECKVIDGNFTLVGLNGNISSVNDSSSDATDSLDQQLCSVIMNTCSLFEDGKLYEMCKECGYKY
ncbi:MAG: M4 family metallopeptidase [Bacteriovoracaceae bacterium]|nr:M4 family metallopeptidase [Bacteriovoracaceae bacterium]